MTATNKNALCAFAVFLATVTLSGSQSQPQEFAFDRDLESWHRLKRQAGYYTDSYVYKGGVYQLAKSDDSAFFTCSKHNGQYCMEWMSKADRADDTESGSCTCQQAHSSYCSLWICIHMPLGTAVRCSDRICRDANQNEPSTCTCSVESQNQRYCEEWSCTQINADGTVDDSNSVCLREDSSGQYCARWKEHRVSKREVQASVCECSLRNHYHCSRWVCQERSMIKCGAYNSRWCNLKYGLGLGGVGAFSMIVSLAMTVVFVSRQKKRKRWAVFILAFAACLICVVGVAIWGGLWVVLYVGAGWLVLLVVLCSCLCFFNSDSERLWSLPSPPTY